MEPRIIKTDEQYQAFLSEVERLAIEDPDPASGDGARLELLAKLVSDYEKERFPFGTPDPIDAIVFRMEQAGLRQRDIAEALGGKNRASEVLARKRPLSLSMIRAIHEQLSIPAELLIREPQADYDTNDEVDIPAQSLDLVVKRGWATTQAAASGLIRQLMAPPGSPAYLRRTLTFGATAGTNRTHVWLWLGRIQSVAEARTALRGRFDKASMGHDLIQYVAKLSYMAEGPRLAVKFLEERGIAVVIEPHLPSTLLDGAAILGKGGAPIIGLSLRVDRLDNFWFTLVHELVHVWKHLDPDSRRAIADENIEKALDSEAIEQEANDLATEILIPRSLWRRSEVFRRPSADAIEALAAELQISPAIVAGRVRHERQNYSLFSGLVGNKKVRVQFPEVNWR